MNTCKINGCKGRVVAWDICDKHYRRFKRHGNYKLQGRKVYSIKERFDSKYLAVPECGCWLWEGATSGKGEYGVIGIDGKNIYAHHISWKLHRGLIPKGLFVLHKCDTPCCVNPEHLWLGTPKDNMDDAVKKGRLNYKEVSQKANDGRWGKHREELLNRINSHGL